MCTMSRNRRRFWVNVVEFINDTRIFRMSPHTHTSLGLIKTSLCISSYTAETQRSSLNYLCSWREWENFKLTNNFKLTWNVIKCECDTCWSHFELFNNIAFKSANFRVHWERRASAVYTHSIHIRSQCFVKWFVSKSLDLFHLQSY